MEDIERLKKEMLERVELSTSSQRVQGMQVFALFHIAQELTEIRKQLENLASQQ